MNESDENVKLPDSKSKYSSDLSLKDKLATTVIGLLVALALTVFTVLVLHVRITESFGIETREERIMTFMQLVVWFLTFVGAWKILNLVDRDAAERDKAAGKTGAGDKAAGDKAIKHREIRREARCKISMPFAVLLECPQRHCDHAAPLVPVLSLYVRVLSGRLKSGYDKSDQGLCHGYDADRDQLEAR